MWTIADGTTPGPRARSYWVVPGRLLAGAYPGPGNDPVATLVGAGVTAFVNLTEDLDPTSVDATLERYDRHLSDGTRIYRHPIRDLDVPSPEYMADTLDTIDGVLDDGHTVYVHCWGGIGRTGTVVGCWLVRHRLVGPDEAVDVIARLRSHDAARHVRSPETDEQVRFIESWQPGS